MPRIRLKQIDGVIDGALDLQVVQWDDANKVWKPGRRNNSAAVDPTANDDSGDGYEKGSIWINTVTKNAFICTDESVGVAVWVGVGVSGEPYQESLTTENISGADTSLADALSYEPVSDVSVVVYLNGAQQEQGAGKDYQVDHAVSPPKIKWLANTGTAVDMDTNDILVVTYETLGL